MIHLLTLGIPGSAATAVMMGAFMIHGIQPGPLLFTKQTAEVYAIIGGMILANIVMIGLGFVAALSFATLMKVPAAVLNTFIIVFCFLGAYALRNDMADVWLTMLFGILGFVMRRWDLPIPPLVMGVILGPMAEQYFLTSMVSHANDVSIFVTRPVSAVILLLSALMVSGRSGRPGAAVVDSESRTRLDFQSLQFDVWRGAAWRRFLCPSISQPKGPRARMPPAWPRSLAGLGASPPSSPRSWHTPRCGTDWATSVGST